MDSPRDQAFPASFPDISWHRIILLHHATAREESLALMAALSQKEQLALHEFSVRYRAALAKRHMTPEQSMDTVKDAVREQYEQEQDAKRSPSVEPPSPTPEREPEEPEP